MTKEEPLDSQRVCRKCGSEKPVSAFMKVDKYMCLECNREYHRADYWKHRDRKLDKFRKYWKTEKARTTHKKWLLRLVEDPGFKVKNEARKRFKNAVYNGHIKKPEFCSSCQTATKLDFHHTNGYEGDNWRVGEWLCRPCHAQIHRKVTV